jgi:hypothetical protein
MSERQKDLKIEIVAAATKIFRREIILKLGSISVS